MQDDIEFFDDNTIAGLGIDDETGQISLTAVGLEGMSSDELHANPARHGFDADRLADLSI